MSPVSTSQQHGSGTTPRTLPFYSVLFHVKYEHLLGGVSGGVVSTLVLHPLELLKIRFAVNDGYLKTRPQYKGIVHAISTILKEEGTRGLYRGVTPNCWGAGTAWGFYFFFYNAIKAWMLDGTSKTNLGPGRHMLAAAEAGILTLAITNPVWVVKTRMCLQYANLETLSPSKRYSGMIDALAKIYRYEGFRGLYKGFIPGIFGVSHGALQFMAYEEMKKFYINHYNLTSDAKLGVLEYLTFAATSKLFAASATYPYQVIRARLQDQHKEYNGVVDVLKKTWRFEGARGFYKGLLPSLLRVTPATAITFVVYENVSQFLLHKK